MSAYDDAFGSVRWAATFNDRTPTEFVTAFTTALPRHTPKAPTPTSTARPTSPSRRSLR
ncbi:DUF317 domain-containing protein [Streptomyces roseifaciens]